MQSQTLFPLDGKRIWVAGRRGMVGSAVVRRLMQTGAEVLTVDRSALDLRNQAAVGKWISQNRPDAIIVAAATVGGIQANRTRPAEFLFDNLAIAANIINAAADNDVRKLMFLGAACFYPREAQQPIREESILTGPFEPTNEWYAVAKIAGVKMCQAYRRQYGRDFIAVVPTSLYGPGDHFDLAVSHVIPALIQRFHEAKMHGGTSVTLWGTGQPLREYLYVDDAADALAFLMEKYSEEAIINVAGGEEVRICELADQIADIVEYRGEILYDASKPDGMPRRILDNSRLSLMGWHPSVSLRDGLIQTYAWYLKTLGEPSRDVDATRLTD